MSPDVSTPSSNGCSARGGPGAIKVDSAENLPEDAIIATADSLIGFGIVGLEKKRVLKVEPTSHPRHGQWPAGRRGGYCGGENPRIRSRSAGDWTAL
jgi:hypothetical protein